MSTTMVNTKISEIERKISDAKGLVVTNVLNTKNEEAENKIPDANVGVKKMVYNAKISDIEANYFTTSDYNKFQSETFVMKIK